MNDEEMKQQGLSLNDRGLWTTSIIDVDETSGKQERKERYVDINPVLNIFCCLDQPDGVLPQMEGVIKGKNSL